MHSRTLNDAEMIEIINIIREESNSAEFIDSSSSTEAISHLHSEGVSMDSDVGSAAFFEKEMQDFIETFFKAKPSLQNAAVSAWIL